MRIRVIRRPTGAPYGGTDSYRPGQVYDVPATLGEYLVAKGFAAVEMRGNSTHQQFAGRERRKFYEVIEEHRSGKKLRDK